MSLGAATVRTANDGSFDVTNVAPSTATVDFTYLGAGYPAYPDAQWVDIVPTDGHAAYHAIRSIATTGTTNLGSIAIALPSATDIAWLARINDDRATLGVPPVNAPLIFESITLQTARYWGGANANRRFFLTRLPVRAFGVHRLLALCHAARRYAVVAKHRSAAGRRTWQAAQSAFMAETANCPGANWQTCTYSEATGHYINIMQAANWAGVGAAGPDYVENFSTPASVNALYFRYVPQYPHALQF